MTEDKFLRCGHGVSCTESTEAITIIWGIEDVIEGMLGTFFEVICRSDIGWGEHGVITGPRSATIKGYQEHDEGGA